MVKFQKVSKYNDHDCSIKIISYKIFQVTEQSKTYNWMETEHSTKFCYRNKTLLVAVENYAKAHTRLSVGVQFCLIFLLRKNILSLILVER